MQFETDSGHGDDDRFMRLLRRWHGRRADHRGDDFEFRLAVSVFVCGAIPFARGLLMWVALPESVQFLLSCKGDAARIYRGNAKIALAADVPPDAVFEVSERIPKVIPFVALSKGGRVSDLEGRPARASYQARALG